MNGYTDEGRYVFLFFTFGPFGNHPKKPTCEAGRADAAVAVNQVNTRGIVQAGGRHALIYVDFTAGPCNDVAFKKQKKNIHTVPCCSFNW